MLGLVPGLSPGSIHLINARRKEHCVKSLKLCIVGRRRVCWKTLLAPTWQRWLLLQKLLLKQLPLLLSLLGQVLWRKIFYQKKLVSSRTSVELFISSRTWKLLTHLVKQKGTCCRNRRTLLQRGPQWWISLNGKLWIFPWPPCGNVHCIAKFHKGNHDCNPGMCWSRDWSCWNCCGVSCRSCGIPWGGTPDCAPTCGSSHMTVCDLLCGSCCINWKENMSLIGFMILFLIVFLFLKIPFWIEESQTHFLRAVGDVGVRANRIL